MEADSVYAFMIENQKSPHILSTSANMLGLCLIVLTSLKISNYREEGIIDELTAVASMLFMLSSFFSFMSIRTRKAALSEKYENIADNIFLVSLFNLSAIIVVITFSFF